MGYRSQDGCPVLPVFHRGGLCSRLAGKTVRQVAALDLITSVVLTLSEIHDMVTGMFEVEKDRLPRFGP